MVRRIAYSILLSEQNYFVNHPPRDRSHTTEPTFLFVTWVCAQLFSSSLSLTNAVISVYSYILARSLSIQALAPRVERHVHRLKGLSTMGLMAEFNFTKTEKTTDLVLSINMDSLCTPLIYQRMTVLAEDGSKPNFHVMRPVYVRYLDGN